MKLLSTFSAVVLSSALALGQAQSAVLWKSDFSDTSLFPVDADPDTVVGAHGWVAAGIQSGNETDAHIVTLNGTRVLGLVSSAEGTTLGFTGIRNNVGATETFPAQVRVQFGMGISAFQASYTTAAGGIYLGANDNNTAYPVSVTLSTSNGGLRFSRSLDGVNDHTLLLATDQIKTDYLYQFDITLDYTAKTFTLNFSGEDAEGQAVNQTFENVSFRTGVNHSSLANLYVVNNQGHRATMYLDQIAVAESIPEPSTVAGLTVGGAVLLGMGAFRRKRRNKASAGRH